MWFSVAASNGYKPALTDQKIAQVGMAPEDIAKAQALARECVANRYKGCYTLQ
jgi:hypothetical protein